MGLAPSPTPTSSATDAVLLMVGDFDCSGEDIERDWVERTGC
ncbi:hypothetical protein [Streptomyces lydicus]